MTCRARLYLMTATVLIAACSGQTAFDRVAVRVSVFPESVAAGDSVTVVVSVRNIDADPVTLAFDTDCQLLYRIVAANGLQVGPPSPWVCTQGRTALVLASGEVSERVFTWIAQVPAGVYRAYGTVGENRAREAGPLLLTVQ